MPFNRSTVTRMGWRKGVQLSGTERPVRLPVVNGKYGRHLGEFIVFTNLRHHKRNEPGLLVVTVNNVRNSTQLIKPIKGSYLESYKTFGIIVVRIDVLSVK